MPRDSEAPPGTNADILTVSRLSKADNYKGIDHLIEAMPQIRQEVPAARLRIVGRGDDLPRLQSLADDRASTRPTPFSAVTRRPSSARAVTPLGL